MTSESFCFGSDSGFVSPLLSVCLVSRTSAYANGGTAAYIRFLGETLRRRGSNVSAVARFFQEQPPVTRYEATETTDAPKRAAIMTGAGNDLPLTLIAPSGTTRSTLGRLPSLLSRPHAHSAGIALFNYAYRKQIAAAIPNDADIIHYTGNGWEMIGFTALAEARRRGISFTVTPFVHPGEWGDSPLDVRLYNAADAVLVCSEDEKRQLIARGVQPDRLFRTWLAPASAVEGDGARFRKVHDLGERPLLLFIGRRQRYKGYHALCMAMEMIQRQIPDVCLVVLGPDVEPPYPELPPGLLLDLGAPPIDSLDKPDALAACDLYCMPSEAESFGIVYVEAWANGMPVIGGTAPAVRELIEEGVTGFCVTQDPAKIAEIVIRTLQDSSARKRMGEAGRRLQQNRYNWNSVAANHEQIFEMARRHTAASK